jgi:hypothetical protein
MSQGYFTDDSVLRRVHQERPLARAVEEEDPQLVID